MSIIADLQNRDYYEMRAIEEIHAARYIRRDGIMTMHYWGHIKKAIQLLLLAKMIHEPAETS